MSTGMFGSSAIHCFQIKLPKNNTKPLNRLPNKHLHIKQTYLPHNSTKNRAIPPDIYLEQVHFNDKKH